ncbi:hypothetical protein O3M35_006249 [Rhynocoris fuscipes]|uniref:Axin n=1 Tax=Rhynocoris fuscipes TaxID=488301 RepID=A0AAW1DK76_9HEMI
MNEFHFNQPRPPVVPGEETEGAVCSSGLNNEVCQPRQIHQSTVTPRSFSTTLQHTVQDGDAPLGFEPEGRSVSPQRCHTENYPGEAGRDVDLNLNNNNNKRNAISPPSSPPACLQWARDLHTLLADPEGVAIFRTYLVQEGLSDHLDFWFACQGLRKQTTDDRIAQFLKVIYRHYFLKSQLGIEENLRKNVHKRMKECGRSMPDVTIFDEAQRQVESIIRETTYPNFLKSEVYLEYVRNVQAGKADGDEESELRSSSPCMNVSGGSSGRGSPVDRCVDIVQSCATEFLPSSGIPQSSSLATVHEDRELDTTRDDNDLNQLPVALPIINTIPSSSSFPPLTKDMLIMTQKRRAHDVRPRTETFAAGVFMHGSSKPKVYSSYNPVSRQDSELQSLSSDARTESDNMSLTDSSVDGAASTLHHRMTRKQYQRHCRQVKESANLNRDPHMHHTVIPRTQRINTTQIHQMKPEEFAAVLIEKLEIVKRNQEVQEKLTYRLFTSEPGAAPSAKTLADAIRERFQIDEDNDQDILDQHVSRVWSDQTPSRTPGVSSPRPRSPPDHLKGRKTNKGAGGNILASSHTSYQKQGLHSVPYPYQSKGSHSSSRYNKKDKDLFSTFSSDSGNVHDFPDHRLHFPKSKSVPDYQDSTTDTYSSLHSHDGRVRSGSRDWNSSGSRRHAKKPEQTDSGVSVVSDASIHGSNKDSRVLSWLIESDRSCAGCAMADRDSGSSCSGGSRFESKHHVRPNMLRTGRRSPPGPAQPFVADPNMPPLPLPHTPTQLDEARRRLEDQHRMVKQHSRCTSGTTQASYLGSGNKTEPASLGSTTLPGYRKTIPPTSQVQQSISNPILPSGPSSISSSQTSSVHTTVVFSFCDEQFPYRTKIPGHPVTLRQFKEFLPKKGNYRYFFKTECEELDMKVIQEEITDDNEVLPLWEGKVMAQVKPID